MNRAYPRASLEDGRMNVFPGTGEILIVGAVAVIVIVALVVVSLRRR